MKVSCSCGFIGLLEDLLIDDENHRVFYCPSCHLTGGLFFYNGKDLVGKPLSSIAKVMANLKCQSF